MQHSQLIRLLKSFSAKELEQLRLFVISPFFNNSQDSPILLDYAIEIIEKEKQKPIIDPETETEEQKLARIEAEKLEAEQHYIEAYRRLNPKKAKDPPKVVIVKKMAPLLSLVEQFIEHNHLKNEIAERKHASTTQLEYCVKRALENEFENEYAKVENERANVVTKNAHYHLKNFEIAEILGAYNTRYNDKNKADEPNLESIRRIRHLLFGKKNRILMPLLQSYASRKGRICPAPRKRTALVSAAKPFFSKTGN